MMIGIPRERVPNENRVAIIPTGVSTLLEAGYEVIVESGAGLAAHFTDDDYRHAGAIIADDASALYRQASVILKVLAPTLEEADLIQEESTIISLLNPWFNKPLLERFASRKVQAFALDLVPRTTRAQPMDVLSAMAGISGYRAVLSGAMALPRYFPMLMTAAGTIHPARVLVIGAGVAGLMAIATARRLGAVVEAYDLRPEVKEQVQSLGADFIEIQVPSSETSGDSGYAKAQSEAFYTAQRQQLADCVARADMVVTTAAVPGKQAPKLINSDMIHRMKSGSVIVDLVADKGGNVEGTVLNKKIVVDGVTLVGHANHPSRVPVHASQLLTRNITAFLLNMTKAGQLVPNFDDDIVSATLVTQGGQVLHGAEPSAPKNEPTESKETA
ncbi:MULTISPECIES: Re/Si-specific NAD(P)(+) transhydrogenase subunit alpha [unclassified Marinobacter]|uniref:Re/Si-specific NAD(P)(+) transhydrogenase subunit alpha n=1 Tax=unclassified Marinobacter TaxID=83889 RepID=UPI000718C155|nr:MULTISPECIES: Re/Si-specific NAD(P)(+) transhydrogenase subunit alpha [unclassified Marinobacter]MDX5440293.1 Re/Si-specific NAD(P)(+) transhydrogenase subunit alpha [Alteromonadaceae bacterium]AMQ88888.1 NAD(P) transhydrogenase subunit alpha [Marinobacter sp. LQ44]MDX5328363.1 Re/Si-specific NAD(P)(+) transhydrogenase subunit alpha [Marinobacter sp.]MDX5335611.1 Re/Si-specific NAD(P)(+) transhydrogenase subunit alpha [Marinobacter sp.]MDX5386497.1 Re/Si-specific NAD(P)(+) transhydrogenase 